MKHICQCLSCLNCLWTWICIVKDIICTLQLISEKKQKRQCKLLWLSTHSDVKFRQNKLQANGDRCYRSVFHLNKIDNQSPTVSRSEWAMRRFFLQVPRLTSFVPGMEYMYSIRIYLEVYFCFTMDSAHNWGKRNDCGTLMKAITKIFECKHYYRGVDLWGSSDIRVVSSRVASQNVEPMDFAELTTVPCVHHSVLNAACAEPGNC